MLQNDLDISGEFLSEAYMRDELSWSEILGVFRSILSTGVLQQCFLEWLYEVCWLV